MYQLVIFFQNLWRKYHRDTASRHCTQQEEKYFIPVTGNSRNNLPYWARQRSCSSHEGLVQSRGGSGTLHVVIIESYIDVFIIDS